MTNPDPVVLCRQTLAGRSSSAAGGAFAAAVAATRGRHLARAAVALATLDDDSLYLAAQFVGLDWVRGGGQREALTPVHDLCQRRFNRDNVDWLFKAGRPWVDLWAREVGQYQALPTLLTFSGRNPDLVLSMCARAALQKGDLARGRSLAEAIPAFHREERAETLARVAVAFAEGPERRQVLAAALDVPRQLIQAGDEESEAFGRLVGVLAEAGITADDPAVQLAFDRLLEFGKTPVSHDGRSPGLHRAALAATKRARLTGDRAWLARAESLLRYIYSDHLLQSAAIAAGLVYRAWGDEVQAERVANVGETKMPPAFARAVPDFEGLVLLWNREFRQGLDRLLSMSAASQPAAANAGDLQKSFTALREAERLEDDALCRQRAAALPLDELWPMHMVLISRWIDVGAQARLEERFTACANPKDQKHRMEGLAILAALHLSAGRWDDGQRLLQAALVPCAAADLPGWVSVEQKRPSYPAMPMTLATGPMPAVPVAEGIRQAQAREQVLDQLLALAELARAVAGDPKCLAAVHSAVHKLSPKRDTTIKICKECCLAYVKLLGDDIDGALELAGKIPDCRMVGWGGWRVAVLASQWLAERPAEITPERLTGLFRIFQGTIAQDLATPLLRVFPRLVKAAAQFAGQTIDALVEQAQKFAGRGDLAVVQSVMALIQAQGGNIDGARGQFAKGLDMLEKLPSLFDPEDYVIEAIQQATQLPPLEGRAYVIRALRRMNGPAYRVAERWERVMGNLFDAGDQETIPEALADGVTSEVAARVRRAWLHVAPARAPRPVEAVLKLFQLEPASPAEAKEQARCLAAALEREGRAEEARQVRAMAP